METYEEALAWVVAVGLAEDIGPGDITSEATIGADRSARGAFLAKADGVVAGLDAVIAVYGALDPRVRLDLDIADGATLAVGETFGRLEGPARSVLSGERLALNLMQRMSGIATATRRYVDAVSDTPAAIFDTRKTVPGLRLLDKRAVALGGGVNHRLGLYDAILVKDNHIAVAGGVVEAIEAVRRYAVGRSVEVEVVGHAQAMLAAEVGVDVILLDNMTLADIRRAVEAIGGRALTEASGGVTLETVRAVAETGVDRISVGALTHSVIALDVSLEVVL